MKNLKTHKTVTTKKPSGAERRSYKRCTPLGKWPYDISVGSEAEEPIFLLFQIFDLQWLE